MMDSPFRTEWSVLCYTFKMEKLRNKIGAKRQREREREKPYWGSVWAVNATDGFSLEENSSLDRSCPEWKGRPPLKETQKKNSIIKKERDGNDLSSSHFK